MDEQQNNDSFGQSLVSTKQTGRDTQALATVSQAPLSIGNPSQNIDQALSRLHNELFAYGRGLALASGALEPDEQDIKRLEEYARSAAQQYRCEPYNPAKSLQDKLIEDGYQKNLADRKESERAAKFANVALKDAEEKAALAQAQYLPPKQSILLPSAAIAVLCLTAIPTFHDFIFVIDDEFASWTLSIVCGLCVGAFITFMILHETYASDKRTTTNWLGLAAGILISLSLGGLRLRGAQTLSDQLFMGALTDLEIGCVIGLEMLARARRAQASYWEPRKQVFQQAQAKLSVAKLHIQRCEGQLQKLTNAIQTHIDTVKERTMRSLLSDEIDQSAMQSAVAGYFQAIAETRGQIVGAGGSRNG